MDVSKFEPIHTDKAIGVKVLAMRVMMVVVVISIGVMAQFTFGEKLKAWPIAVTVYMVLMSFLIIFLSKWLVGFLLFPYA